MAVATIRAVPEAWRLAAERTPENALVLPWEWLELQGQGGRNARAHAAHIIGDQARYEDSVRSSYTGRFAIELLQNAHDAVADSGSVGQVQFVVTPSALLVANEGVPFTYERIVSLTRLGSSEKALRRGVGRMIGYKGIGFASVFEISANPQILSTLCRFQLNRDRAQDAVRAVLGDGMDEPVSARGFPLPLPDADWEADRDTVRALFAQGAVTVIRLPFDESRDADTIAADVRATVRAETLLFLPAVDRIAISDVSGTSSWKRTSVGRLVVRVASNEGERREWARVTARVPLPDGLARRLDSPMWQNVRELNVAAALPLMDGKPDPTAATTDHLYAYFPTDDRLGRRVLVHGDFFLDPTRRRIESRGAGGEVSNLVAEGVAQLTTRLAARYARHGLALLECIAPLAPSDGFGVAVGAAIDVALRSSPVLRMHGRGYASPSEAVSLDSAHDVAMRKRLAGLLSPANDLVLADDVTPLIAPWLRALGVQQLAPTSIASRVAMKGARSYQAGLRTLAEWVDRLDWSERMAAVRALGDQPIVRDAKGQFRLPAEVALPSPGVPALPDFLRRAEAVWPRDREAAALLRELHVRELDAEASLGALLKAYGSPRTERQARLMWQVLTRLWRHDRSIFIDKRALGRALVPVTLARGTRVSWRRASATYFSWHWTRSRVLEEVYGPLRSREFLARPAIAGDFAGARDFYRALGVREHPAVLPLEQVQGQLAHFKEWLGLPEVVAAHTCSQNHPFSDRQYRGEVIDRLDELLARNPSGVARALLATESPYADAGVRCDHSAHRGAQNWRPAPGYQAWRLRSTAWVPVIDPSGRPLRSPGEAWANLPARANWLRLPRARFGDADAAKLGLILADRPRPEAAEGALEELRSTYPELAEAPTAVHRTAEWLLARLERVLRRSDRDRPARPWFPARTGTAPTWTQDPVIADVPGFPVLEGLATIAPQPWIGIRRAYGIQRLSERAAAEVTVGARRVRTTVMSGERRAQLLAVLVAGGVDATNVSGRLAALREQAVASLEVAWSIAEQESIKTAPSFYLEVQRESRGRRVGAMLWTTDRQADTLELGATLADYLGTPEQAADVQLFLQDPEHLMRYRFVTAEDVREALDVLNQRRFFRSAVAFGEAFAPAPGGQEQTESHPEATDQDQQAHAARGASGGPGDRTYVDPRSVGFGAGRHVDGTAPAAPRRRSDSPPPSPAANDKKKSYYVAGVPASTHQPVVNRDAEWRAVDISVRFAREELGAIDVRDRQADDVGWDLEFEFSNGYVELAEIKGSSGDEPFYLTPNELEKAREHANYVLYQVANLARPEATVLRRYVRIGERLTPSHLRIATYLVTGWLSLEREEFPIES